MRTTLAIDDQLLAHARREALERNLTLGEVINRALRRGLLETPAAGTTWETLTFGDPNVPPPDPARISELENDEVEWLRRKCGL